MKRQRTIIHFSALYREDVGKDILDQEHDLGLSLTSDEEHPMPLQTLLDIEKAEQYKKTH